MSVARRLSLAVAGEGESLELAPPWEGGGDRSSGCSGGSDVLQALLILHRRRRFSTIGALIPGAPVLYRGRRHQLGLG
jgi:hypothetical protein